MSHGFSRFGNPGARERFQAKAQGRGSFAIFLPTILATLFLFTSMIALNNFTSFWKGKTIRLINVDDVFPDPAAVEKNSTKEYWEAPPPPAPVASPDFASPDLATQAPPRLGERTGSIVPAGDPAESVLSTPALPALTSINPDIRMPDVKPDTSLPGTVQP